MRYFKKLILIWWLAFLSAPAFSGQGAGNIEIESVGGYKSGNIVFLYTTTHNNRPPCNTYRERWALDLSVAGAKEQLALLLAAQMADKPVVIKGTGDCSVYIDNDSEGVFWVGYEVTHP